MDAVAPMNVVIDDLIEMNELFADVATGDGLALPLLLAGTILVAAALGVFGYLSLGAAVNLVRS